METVRIQDRKRQAGLLPAGKPTPTTLLPLRRGVSQPTNLEKAGAAAGKQAPFLQSTPRIDTDATVRSPKQLGHDSEIQHGRD